MALASRLSLVIAWLAWPVAAPLSAAAPVSVADALLYQHNDRLGPGAYTMHCSGAVIEAEVLMEAYVLPIED